jgi:hypothetical protein
MEVRSESRARSVSISRASGGGADAQPGGAVGRGIGGRASGETVRDAFDDPASDPRPNVGIMLMPAARMGLLRWFEFSLRPRRTICEKRGEVAPELRDNELREFSNGGHVPQAAMCDRMGCGKEIDRQQSVSGRIEDTSSPGEEGLVSLATHGIVFAPGSAGTVQEIFQDACQNHYGTVQGLVSPMALFGTQYWTERLPVVPLLEALSSGANWSDRVITTDDPDTIVAFLENEGPRAADRRVEGNPGRPSTSWASRPSLERREDDVQIRNPLMQLRWVSVLPGTG